MYIELGPLAPLIEIGHSVSSVGCQPRGQRARHNSAARSGFQNGHWRESGCAFGEVVGIRLEYQRRQVGIVTLRHGACKQLVAFGYRNISIHLVGFYDATSDCMCWLRLVINVKTAVATGRQINRLPLAWRHV